MMLRLGLVGIVAALGVTLPAQPACERWFDSVQSWASATLADWDTWKPGDDRSDYSRYARGKTDCLQCRLAQAKLAAMPQDPVTTAAHEAVAKVSHDGPISVKPAVAKPAESTSPVADHPSVKFTTIAAQEAASSQIAFELNRIADGINVPPGTSNPPTPAPGPPPAVIAWSGSWEPVAASDDLELSALGAFCCGFAGEHSAGAEFAANATPDTRDVAQPDDGSSVGGGAAVDAGADDWEVASFEREPEFTAEVTGWEFVALVATNRTFCLGTECPLNGCLGDAPTAPRIASLPDLPQDVFGPAPQATRPEPPRVVSAPLQAVTPADVPPVAPEPSQAAAALEVPAPPQVVAWVDLPRNVFGLPEPGLEPKSLSPQPGIAGESNPPAPIDTATVASAVADQSPIALLDDDSQDRPATASSPSPRVEQQQIDAGERLSSARPTVGRRSAEPRLGHAVELTREALYAWMNVLAGPALVDVTSR